MAISTNSAVILARVSSKAQEDEGYSLDSQLKLLRAYCSKNRLTVVKEFKVAETASKQHSRIIFQEMIRYLKKEKINHLAVEKTDRLTRNMRDAVTIDDWLEANKDRRLHAVKENLLLHKHARSDVKFAWSICLAFAKKYTDGLREEAMKGWAEKLAQGWLPAPPPPGYMTITNCGKKIHVPDPATTEIVQQAFALYATPDYTVSLLTDKLAIMGLTTSKGRPLSKSSIHKMLDNPFYIGINRFDGKEYPGAQEPIISKNLFAKVQAKLHGRIQTRSSHTSKAVFKGTIHCEHCNGIITWQLQKGRYYGACRRRLVQCKERPLLREDRVEAMVFQKLEDVNDESGKLLARLHTKFNIIKKQNVGEFRQKMIGSLQDQLKRMDSMKDALYDDKLSGYITTEKYEHKLQQLNGQKTQIEDRLNRIYEAESITVPTNTKRLHKNPIVDLYLKSVPVQKRIIIATIFEPIFTYNENIKLDCKY